MKGKRQHFSSRGQLHQTRGFLMARDIQEHLSFFSKNVYMSKKFSCSTRKKVIIWLNQSVQSQTFQLKNVRN